MPDMSNETAYAWDQEVVQRDGDTDRLARRLATGPAYHRLKVLREYNSARRNSPTRRRLQPAIDAIRAVRDAEETVEARRDFSAGYGEMIVRFTPTQMTIR